MILDYLEKCSLKVSCSESPFDSNVDRFVRALSTNDIPAECGCPENDLVYRSISCVLPSKRSSVRRWPIPPLWSAPGDVASPIN